MEILEAFVPIQLTVCVGSAPRTAFPGNTHRKFVDPTFSSPFIHLKYTAGRCSRTKHDYQREC